MKKELKVFFIYHTRHLDDEEKDKPKKQRRHRTTYVGFIVGDNIQIGTAVCSHSDQFSKKEGRVLATGRAVWNPDAVIDKCDTIKESKNAFISVCKSGVL